MNEKYRDETYIEHVLENIELVEKEFAQPGSKQRFSDDIFFRFGVYYALQTLGESTKCLSEELKRELPEIPWDRIWGFRNVMAHDYLGDIEPEMVLDVIKEHLPILKQAMETLKGKL